MFKAKSIPWLNFIYVAGLVLACLVVSINLSACGHGVCRSNSHQYDSPFESAYFTSSHEYPSGVALTIPVVFTNAGQKAFTSLTYKLTSLTNTNNLSLVQSSLDKCVNVESGRSCTLLVNVAANSIPGTFTISASSHAKEGVISKLWQQKLDYNDSIVSLNSSIGLTQLPQNNESGISGVNFYYPSVISLPNNDVSIAS